MADDPNIKGAVQSKAQDAITQKIKEYGAEHALEDIGKSLASAADSAAAGLCDVYPIRLDHFTLAPKGVRIRYGRSNATMVEVDATLSPEVRNPSGLFAELQSDDFNLVKQLLSQKGIPSNISTAIAVGWEGYKALADMSEALAAAEAAKLFSVPTDPANDPKYQVGACDLLDVWGLHNKAGLGDYDNVTKKRTSLITKPVVDQPIEGRDNYIWYAYHTGVSETLCISPMWQNFVFHSKVEQTHGLYLRRPCPFTPITGPVPASEPRLAAVSQGIPPIFTTDIGTGDAGPTVSVVSDNAFAGLTYDIYETGPDGGEQQSYQSPDGAAQLLDLPDNKSESWGPATASLTATQTGSNTWMATANISWQVFPDPNFPSQASQLYGAFVVLWLRYTIPSNRDNSQSVHVQLSTDPSCTHGGFVSGASASDIDGKFTFTGCPQPMACQETNTEPNWSFDSVGAVTGQVSFAMNPSADLLGPTDGGSCGLKVTITVDP